MKQVKSARLSSLRKKRNYQCWSRCWQSRTSSWNIKRQIRLIRYKKTHQIWICTCQAVKTPNIVSTNIIMRELSIIKSLKIAVMWVSTKSQTCCSNSVANLREVRSKLQRIELIKTINISVEVLQEGHCHP